MPLIQLLPVAFSFLFPVPTFLSPALSCSPASTTPSSFAFFSSFVWVLASFSLSFPSLVFSSGFGTSNTNSSWINCVFTSRTWSTGCVSAVNCKGVLDSPVATGWTYPLFSNTDITVAVAGLLKLNFFARALIAAMRSCRDSRFSINLTRCSSASSFLIFKLLIICAWAVNANRIARSFLGPFELLFWIRSFMRDLECDCCLWIFFLCWSALNTCSSTFAMATFLRTALTTLFRNLFLWNICWIETLPFLSLRTSASVLVFCESSYVKTFLLSLRTSMPLPLITRYQNNSTTEHMAARKTPISTNIKNIPTCSTNSELSVDTRVWSCNPATNLTVVATKASWHTWNTIRLRCGWKVVNIIMDARQIEMAIGNWTRGSGTKTNTPHSINFRTNSSMSHHSARFVYRLYNQPIWDFTLVVYNELRRKNRTPIAIMGMPNEKQVKIMYTKTLQYFHSSLEQRNE